MHACKRQATTDERELEATHTNTVQWKQLSVCCFWEAASVYVQQPSRGRKRKLQVWRDARQRQVKDSRTEKDITKQPHERQTDKREPESEERHTKRKRIPKGRDRTSCDDCRQKRADIDRVKQQHLCHHHTRCGSLWHTRTGPMERCQITSAVPMGEKRKQRSTRPRPTEVSIRAS